MYQKLVTAGLVALALSLGLGAPVIAGPFEDASAAYKRGDYASAARLLRPLANQGVAPAERSWGHVPHRPGRAAGLCRSSEVASQGCQPR
jgi:hypothetical protein